MEGVVLIAVSEGGVRRYEVDENVDGFVVLQRDLATGKETTERLFRTAPAAFAYAELAAAMERCSSRATDDDAFEQDTLRASEARFAQTRVHLADDGVPGDIVEAWRRAEEQQRRVRYH
jgi:hypothetical protein